MIKRVSPESQLSVEQLKLDLVDMIERALQLAERLDQRRTAVALDDALVHANRAKSL